ncbi:hypothetical protein [Psychrobacter fulvigenes]|uniref:hypothetical protein n=1 Tax=Psychrobacter fulvigenes TaxID=533323 RepID=UPI001917B6FE|nr:hypothetical protein [Psychrobacter fulvigenes]
MKTDSHSVTSPWHFTITKHKVLLIGSVLSGAILATGCQSTSLGQSNTMATNQTPAAAKTALANALQKQRRQSFSYHSNLEVSNDQQFTDVDSQQLAVSDYVEAHCEDTHDKAYAALLEQAEAQDKEVLATEYDAQRSAIKQSYLACSDAYQAWEDNQYNSRYNADYDDSSNYNYGSDHTSQNSDNANEANEDSNRKLLTAIEEEYGGEGDSLVETRTIKSNASNDNVVKEKTVSPYYQQLFDNYDDKPTPQDIKKAQLLDAYLLKPLSINAQGIYQPMAGKATMLASVQYQARNHQSSINQPIYIDFKNGNIYLWADNFAMLNSELLDDKLGTKWRNKWLKIAMDDGTLPKGFGGEVIKAHFEALDRTYERAPVSQFNYVAPNTLASLTPKMPQHQLPTMLASTQVISRVQSTEDYEQFYQDYMRLFYDRITKQYPELVKDNQMFEQAENITDSEDRGFTSKAMVQQALALIKSMIDNGSSPTDVIPKASLSEDLAIQELYGLDKRGQIKWQHIRSEFPSQTQSVRNKSDKGIVIDILQQYSPLRTQDMAFPNLAADVQIPNASNSIDLREYGSELIQYYRDGKGTAMGKMMFSVMPLAKDQLGSID